MSDCTCDCCDGALERLRYFPRQLLKAEDMRAEQDFNLRRARRHNRLLHGWGVTCGLDVAAPQKGDPPWQVTICPGHLVSPQGDDVEVCAPVAFDVATGAQQPEPCCDPWPCPPKGGMPGGANRETIAFLAIRYAECEIRPVRTQPSGCGCDETGCENTRIRESFEIRLLWELPESHVAARDFDRKWQALIAKWASGQEGFLGLGGGSGNANAAEAASTATGMSFANNTASELAIRQRIALPVPPCPPCTSDPWVVIAALRLPAKRDTAITAADISYLPRRVLWSVGTFMAALGL